MNLKNKWKRADWKAWYDIWLERLLDNKNFLNEKELLEIIKCLKVKDIIKYYKNNNFKKTDKIKNEIFNNLLVFSNFIQIDDNSYYIFDELYSFVLSQLSKDKKNEIKKQVNMLKKHRE